MNLYFRREPARGQDSDQLSVTSHQLMIEPRFYCGGSSTPVPTDPNVAAASGSAADAANYPFKAQIDALAQTGGSGTINGTWYNFSGLGTADQNSAVSNQMAQAMLDIQKNYGPAYVTQRLADLQQSDPTGYAARKQLFDKIIADSQANPNRPMATDLQTQVASLLGQGSNLTTGPNSETEQVQQGVRGQQVSNGIYLGNAPASQEASAIVNAGDAQQQQRQTTAATFLNSGVSPEDVTYRRVQQSLSNLGNAIAGQTPEAQFASLSGAQGGAAPFNTGNVQSPSINPNAALQGLQNASQIYSGQVNWNNAQVNPWSVGLSTSANTLGALKSVGAFGSQAAPVTSTMGGFGSTPATSDFGATASGASATAADYAAGMVPG